MLLCPRNTVNSPSNVSQGTPRNLRSTRRRAVDTEDMEVAVSGTPATSKEEPNKKRLRTPEEEEEEARKRQEQEKEVEDLKMKQAYMERRIEEILKN